MSQIVGVHGIAQQQLGRRQLLQAWQPALNDGLEIAGGRPRHELDIDLAYYGELFLRRPKARSSKRDSSIDDYDDLAAMDDDEIADLVSAATEALGPDQTSDLAEVGSAESKAYTRTPRPLQALLRQLDRKFGTSAGILYIGALRQVRRYLTNPSLKTSVDRLVEDTISTDCRILVGHSLGSVVAFEFLRQRPDRRVELFLTVGSPLGLKMVHQRMPRQLFAANSSLGMPDNIARWVNVRDPRDPVACAGDLHLCWPAIQDRCVDNEGDAHSVARYLSKRETGLVIIEALAKV